MMESFITSESWNQIFMLINEIIGEERANKIKEKYEKWENLEGNKYLSFLNKSIQVFLIAKRLFPKIGLESNSQLISIVLKNCKSVGEKIPLKENGIVIEVEIINRMICNDGGLEFHFKRKDGSVVSRVFYD
jgi:hypothetical protein